MAEPQLESFVAPPHVRALEAFAAGEPDETVAAEAGVDPAAAPAAIRVAAAKLLEAARRLAE
jgi:hypothetical protein